MGKLLLEHVKEPGEAEHEDTADAYFEVPAGARGETDLGWVNKRGPTWVANLHC
jgi:hypothetical protein